MFRLFAFLWASRIQVFISSSRLRNFFFVIISLNKLCFPFTFCAPSVTPSHMCILVCVWCPISLFCNLFSFYSSDWVILSDLSLNAVILSSPQFQNFFLVLFYDFFTFLNFSCIIFLILFSCLSSLVAHWASLNGYLEFLFRQFIDIHFIRTSSWCLILFFWWCYVSLINPQPSGV